MNNDDIAETQLDEEDAEAYLMRRAGEREKESEERKKLKEKINSFRWKGGMC